MTDLAVIIVTWNVCNLTLDALRTLYDDLEMSDLSHQVVVVDNASTDGTPEAIAEQFPQVMLVACDENLGFGAGNNRGLRELGFFSDSQKEVLPRVVYLLNADTRTKPGATRTLYEALMQMESIGVVGAQLEYGDGSFQHSAFAFPGLRQLWAEFFPTPGRFIESEFNGRYPRTNYQHGEPFSVDFTLGATWMLKREVIEATGGFDEDFFMYCEEIDWAWRIHKVGWEIKAVPAAQIVHLSGQSTSQVKPRSVINLWQSRLHLFEKHYPAWKRWIARQMIVAGVTRKIRQIELDKSLDKAERAAIVGAYQQVQQLARDS
jgi:N-acetylglucosaminyl-diphospho-decaprenol L-rhamnosyltransferase